MDWRTFETDVKPLFNMFAKNDILTQHELRCKEEWAYALLQGYNEANMHRDFVNIIICVCNFYLDPIYAKAVRSIAEKTQGHFTNSSEESFVIDEDIFQKLVPMTKDINSLKVSQTGSITATASDAMQKYIVFTMGILICSTFTTKNVECTKYHKYFILVLLGLNGDIREEVRKLQKEQKYQDETRRVEVEAKLERLFNYCIVGAKQIINVPFNSHNSATICDSFLLAAIREYEGCI